jgi:23S rRNA pseudouridine1911/1915/1917 synthase
LTAKWIVKEKDPKRLKEFLKDKGVSRRIIGRVKFHGGSFVVNNEEVRVRQELAAGDHVQLNLPIEEPNPNLATIHKPLDIIFEDEYYLVVNKPVDLISVPSSAHREDTVASRVKAYYLEKNYRHKVVHVVTRLDRYTSGVMLIAKNTLAHSMMGTLLEEGKLEKHYQAIVHGHLVIEHGFIDEPIARSEDSIIERTVGIEGKESLTEYKVINYLENDMTHVKLSLHTGRTHQIRVHMAHVGHPLAGDDLYGGSKELIERQALHCSTYRFVHPFTGEQIEVEAPLPADMEALINS